MSIELLNKKLAAAENDGRLSVNVSAGELSRALVEMSVFSLALEAAEALAKECSLMAPDAAHDGSGCRIVAGRGAQPFVVSCWACIAQDRLALIRARPLLKAIAELVAGGSGPEEIKAKGYGVAVALEPASGK